MTEEFDPYRKWLGILAQDQPPHHYRLLGIEPFESDADVICNATDARMAQIKTFQTGKHSDHSQRLLNEVAAAKVCLLNPAKKEKYDKRLREKREEGGGRREENAPELPFGWEDADALEDVPPAVAVSTKRSSYPARRRRKHPSWLVPLIAVGCVSLLIVLLAIWNREYNTAPREKRLEVAPKERRRAPSKGPTAKKEPSDRKPAKPRGPSAESEPRVKEERAAPETPPAEEQPEPLLVIGEPLEPYRPQPIWPKPSAHKPPSARKKHPVPDAAARREAEAEIRSLFSQEFAAADNTKGKLALAATLRKQARGTAGDPAARFVLYRLAGELAAEAGELAKGFAAIDRLAKSYDVNPLTMKADLAAAVVPGYRVGIKNEESIADFWINVNRLMELADEAALSDDFPTAVRAAKLAVTLARATKDAELIRETAARLREIEHQKSRFRPVEAALGVLAENPDDAEANLTVGKWRCFTNGDWRRGLPLLVKGSDAKLVELARRDLAQPAAVEDRLALADAWYEAAAKESSSLKPGLQARAVFWYEQVLPTLSGLDQTRARKRLDELHAKDIRGKKIRGLVVKGDVALAKNGAKVAGPAHGDRLLDGEKVTREKDSTAIGRWPCRWTITLDRVYQLREIRFRLYDYKRRAYQYVLSVSADGNHYTVVKDASQGGWSGWQQVRFSPRPVKTIVLEGLHNNETEYFAVVELEAYCIPPKGM